jgi:2-keto-3-deoxy-L-rhamnonate aldolase RhmA
VAVGTPEEAREHLAMGFSLVMVSNDTTMFGRAVAEAVKASRA